ncbi:MAG: hypothetical protein LWW94_02130 [Candidatus Desulfofervidaceae bacterium]|nr:hypothetical protein [Candidatus Desulfofervidaceae bacterium]
MSDKQILAMERSWRISIITEVFKPEFWPWTLAFTLVGLGIGACYGFFAKRLQEKTETVRASEEIFKVFSKMAKDAFIFFRQKMSKLE